MSSKVVSVTAQAAMFSALSTFLAQGINVWQNKRLSAIDPMQFLIFMIIAVVVTPPNYLYQCFLEDTFPSKVSKDEMEVKKRDEDEKQKQNPTPPPKQTPEPEKLSIVNTAAKFVLDQSIGAAVNTIMFIVLIGLLKGKSLSTVITDVEKDFWPMLKSGWRVWPMVTLLNLLVVPFESRMLVGNTAAVLWGSTWP